jgi:hypothetical protein
MLRIICPLSTKFTQSLSMVGYSLVIFNKITSIKSIQINVMYMFDMYAILL